MTTLSKKKLIVLIATVIYTLVCIGFAVYPITIGEYTNATALLSFTLITLSSTFDYLT